MMKSKKSTLYIVTFLIFWVAPRLVTASELNHVVQGLVPLFWFAVLIVAAIVTLGFASKFLVWPSFSTFTGKAVVVLLIVALLFIIVLLSFIY